MRGPLLTLGALLAAAALDVPVGALAKVLGMGSLCLVGVAVLVGAAGMIARLVATTAVLFVVAGVWPAVVDTVHRSTSRADVASSLGAAFSSILSFTVKSIGVAVGVLLLLGIVRGYLQYRQRRGALRRAFPPEQTSHKRRVDPGP